MHSKYLKCDECGDVLDRRATDDFGGSYRNTASRGTFSPGEWPDLLRYARSLGWYISSSSHDGTHLCPKHPHPINAREEHRKVLDALYETFGYRPDEPGGENWTVYQGHSLIVVHPERRPRIYKRGCGGVYYEIEPDFP